MKNKKFLFLLSAILLGGCSNPQTSESALSESIIEPSESPSIEESSPSESPSVDSDSSLESESEIPSEDSSMDITESSPEPDVPSDDSTSEEPEIPEDPDRVKNVTDYLGSDGDVYRVNITTVDNEFPVDKENYVSGSINITEQDTTKVLHDEMSMRIKLRGNSTLSADKKP